MEKKMEETRPRAVDALATKNLEDIQRLGLTFMRRSECTFGMFFVQLRGD